MPIPFLSFLQPDEEERKRREEARRLAVELAKSRAREFKQKTVSLAQKAEIALENFVARRKEKGQQVLRRGKKTFEALRAPEFPTRVKEKIEKLPISDFPAKVKRTFPALGLVGPKQILKFGAEQILGTEAGRRASIRAEEIQKRVLAGEKVAPEEEKWANKYMLERAAELAIVASPVAPRAVGPVTPKVARQIFKVKKGASQAEIKIAVDKLAKKELPKWLEGLATKREATVGDIIHEAANVLWKGAGGKGLMIRPPVKAPPTPTGLVKPLVKPAPTKPLGDIVPKVNKADVLNTEVFGSRAEGTAKKGSDLDVLVTIKDNSKIGKELATGKFSFRQVVEEKQNIDFYLTPESRLAESRATLGLKPEAEPPVKKAPPVKPPIKKVPEVPGVKLPAKPPIETGLTTFEQDFEKATGVKDYQDFKKNARQPKEMDSMLRTIHSYGNINNLSDQEVKVVFNDLKKKVDAGFFGYNDLVQDLKNDGIATKDDLSALERFKKSKDLFQKAKNRADQVIAVDALMSATHAAGGPFITYVFGIDDVAGDEYWPMKMFDWLAEQKEIKKVVKPPVKKPIAVEEFVPREKPKVTVKQLEKKRRAEKLETYLGEAKTQKELVERVGILNQKVEDATRPIARSALKQARADAVKRMEGLIGVKGMGRNWKEDYSLSQMAKQDPQITEAVDALEDYIFTLDSRIGPKKVRKAYEMALDEGLPVKGDYFIPYGKYSTRGTQNLEWVRENIPLLRMGNKRGMVGYILDGLGVKQKDLGLLAGDDVSHLAKFNQAYDLFGGSGLLSSLSKKLFPGAKITYNELHEGTLSAIEKAKKNPKVIQKFVSEVAVWLKRHPDADWLAHFSTVYKDNEDFLTAARLIEASAGRTEVTADKMQNVMKAIPNFSKTFKGVKTTSEDALKVMDRFIKSGTSKDFLWIDPPYLWSTGYGVGIEMERSSGFRKLLTKLEKLNKKGVKFMFFNNDPEVQVANAGKEAVHLTNIMGQLNRMSENMVVVRGIKPIGAAKRREILITNVDFGKINNRLLNLDETIKAIKALEDDPATAPREVLKMFRELRGTTDLVPQAKRITAHQIRTIRTLRSRLRIKNRELLPIMDEVLDDHSFAKMTVADGKRMISWLQPRNWEIIEDHIARTRKELFAKRKERLIGEKLVAKDAEFEDKFGVIAALNKTTEEIQNIAEVVNDLPPIEAGNSNTLRSFLEWVSPYVSEDLGAKLVGIKSGFHTPMRAIINTSKTHTNRMKKSLAGVFKDLSESERKQVIMIQAGAPSAIKKAASKKVQRTAKYMQDVAEKNIEVINRLRASVNKPPLKSRKPYIPFIIDENISQAADLFDKNKFWQQRTKTFKEFQAGLFTHDPGRIIDIWSQSSGDWLKKNLFSALLLDRYQSLYNVSGSAAAYGRTIVELDIYNMLPQRERLFRSLGSAINKRVGGIYPKKIPIEPELATAIENTTFGKELMADVKKGYLKVPRVQLPNVGDVFHKVFYPAKLAWNFSFGLLNRTQPLAGIPFVGVKSTLVGQAKMYSMIFPWNKVQRQRYIKILEESGYQYGRYVAGQELKPIKGKVGNFVDRSVNFIGDITEMMNRLENEIGAEKFINLAEGKMGEKLSRADKDKVIGTFSAFINFLGGKGYAPPAQRSLVGRFAYTFNQYPLNQINVYTEMYKTAMKDDGVREFWKMMAEEGGASTEAVKFFKKLPDGSKARVFLVLLAIVLPVAMMYAISRSWNVASRALPGLPRIAFADLASSVSDFLEDPEKGADSLTSSVKKLFSVTAKNRLEDALNIVETGILQKGFSKKPLFVDPSNENIYKLFFFGRSALPEYEKQYPSLLGRLFGGRREAGAVKKLKREREKVIKGETETAVEFMRLYTKAKTPEEKRALFKEYAGEGKLTKGVVKKLEQFYKEQATEVGGLERSIVGLKDEDQARFILEQFNKIESVDEKKELMIRYGKQGILTENVIAEMKKLTQEEAFNQGFFGL